jgi:hypothetical protein
MPVEQLEGFVHFKMRELASSIAMRTQSSEASNPVSPPIAVRSEPPVSYACSNRGV